MTWRPRVVVSTARSLTDADRALLESTFGVGVADFYSTSALGLIAYAKPGMKGYRFITEEFHVEVLPAVAGQRGGPERLVITDLVAGTTPLIRFDTGDLVLREAPRPGALTAPPVIGIIGRELPEEPRTLDVDLPDLAGTRISVTCRRWPRAPRGRRAPCTFSSPRTIPDPHAYVSCGAACQGRPRWMGGGVIRAAYRCHSRALPDTVGGRPILGTRVPNPRDVC